MEPMTLSFDVLIAYLNRAIAGMEDPRKTSNATKYSLKDAVLAAFSVFFMQRESFLDYQRYQESHHSKSNAQSLFGVINVPTVPQIRNILALRTLTKITRFFFLRCVRQPGYPG
jgi:hypothetical protein